MTASDGAELDQFGDSVALSGKTAVIGAFGDDDLAPNAGSAYVFEKVGGLWTQTAKLTAADGEFADEFGSSVAVSGDTVLIGAPLDGHDLGFNAGSAYVFEKVGAVWVQTARFTADTNGSIAFGNSVAVSGETAVIGARRDDNLGELSGAAYVFEKVSGLWTRTGKLTASDGAAGDAFGWSVALSAPLADTTVIGALYGDGFRTDSGAAYVFEKIGGVWTQTAKLMATDGDAFDKFGVSVAVSGDTAVIGVSHHDELGTDSGAAYVFDRIGGVWRETGKLTASDGLLGDLFGISVTVSGDTAVIGARGDDELGFNAGSGYAFVPSASADDCNGNSAPDACDIASGTSTDCNGNSIPDDCETDTDGDGVIDDCDPCPLDNPDDTDGDGVCDADDLCSDTPLGLLVDLDGCTLTEGPCCFPGAVCIDGTDRESCEAFPDGAFQGEGLTCGDPDGDGVAGCTDGCPLDPAKVDPGVCGCGVPDDDGDRDGIPDCKDRCLQTPSGADVNVCGCAEVGACCAPGGACFNDIERTVCLMIAGIYQGDGSTCAANCALGDLDGDGDVDLVDFGVFTRCFTGAGGEAGPACSEADVDGCGPIDLEDFAAFRAAFTGP